MQIYFTNKINVNFMSEIRNQKNLMIWKMTKLIRKFQKKFLNEVFSCNFWLNFHWQACDSTNISTTIIISTESKWERDFEHNNTKSKSSSPSSRNACFQEAKVLHHRNHRALIVAFLLPLIPRNAQHKFHPKLTSLHRFSLSHSLYTFDDRRFYLEMLSQRAC